MKISEVKAKAKAVGIEAGKMKKAELIRAIQRAEGYNACYGSEQAKDCPQIACCFIVDCQAE
jgi:hypothetical protein